MKATVDRLYAEKDSITGVVLTSGKKTFFAGGDLKNMIKVGPEDAEQIFNHSVTLKADLRRLETLGKPVVTAINGAALGGGLEIALATHHRIAADVKGVKIGLPEVTLGLLPGGGGVVRTVRMLGLHDRADQTCCCRASSADRSRPRRSAWSTRSSRSVDELVPAAKAWIKANPEGGVQPWDVKGYKIPGGNPVHPGVRGEPAGVPGEPAQDSSRVRRCRRRARSWPPPSKAAQVDIDNALLIESRYFTSLVTGRVAKNMIQAFFFDLQSINGGGSRPARHREAQHQEGRRPRRRHDGRRHRVRLRQGRHSTVVLKDVTIEAAEKGKAYSERHRGQGALARQDHARRSPTPCSR